MANFYGSARTSYVQIDEETAKVFCDKYGVSMSKSYGKKEDGELPWIAFFPDNSSDDGHFPSYITDEDGVDIDFSWEEIYQHLPDGQGLVVMGVGAEKLRYLVGFAEVYSNKGLVDSVNLDDIYQRAKLDHGLETTAAEY